jgi:hypothetical protein
MEFLSMVGAFFSVAFALSISVMGIIIFGTIAVNEIKELLKKPHVQ